MTCEFWTRTAKQVSHVGPDKNTRNEQLCGKLHSVSILCWPVFISFYPTSCDPLSAVLGGRLTMNDMTLREMPFLSVILSTGFVYLGRVVTEQHEHFPVRLEVHLSGGDWRLARPLGRLSTQDRSTASTGHNRRRRPRYWLCVAIEQTSG